MRHEVGGVVGIILRPEVEPPPIVERSIGQVKPVLDERLDA